MTGYFYSADVQCDSISFTDRDWPNIRPEHFYLTSGPISGSFTGYPVINTSDIRPVIRYPVR